MADGAQKPEPRPRKDRGALRSGTRFLRDIWFLGMKKMVSGRTVVFRTHEEKARCSLPGHLPHRFGAQLSAGHGWSEDGSRISECPYHGWRFRPRRPVRGDPLLVADQQFEWASGCANTKLAERQGISSTSTPPRTPATGEPDLAPPEWPGVGGRRRPKCCADCVRRPYRQYGCRPDRPAHGP